ncbi:MAG: hypothetical protein M1829_002050 [Trizodia sp. TS-e1964]|nr:MAG: hypothetical protein M1829_002050 [Trizodia sp. TS-e1964]
MYGGPRETCGEFVVGISKTKSPKSGKETVQKYLIINYSMLGGPRLYCELDYHSHISCGFTAPSEVSTLEITADLRLKSGSRRTALWALEPDESYDLLPAHVRSQMSRLDDYLVPSDSGPYTIRCDPPTKERTKR